MRDKLRCAVIGAGNMGKNHLRVYAELSDVDLVAVAETDEKIGKNMAKKYGVVYYKDYLKMMEEEDIDAVSICAPTSLHHEIGKDCMNKGWDVLLEKPISDKIEKAEELLNLAKIKKTKFLVGHIERFNPAVVKAKEIIKKGELGKVITIIARRVGGMPAQIKEDGVAIDLAIHDIDIVNYLLNDLPADIIVSKKRNHLKNREDSVEFFLKYKSASAYIQANWISPVKIRKLNITGTKGYLELDYLKQEIDLYKTGSDVISLNIKNEEPLKEEIRYFLDCIRGDKKINSKFALDALRIAQS